MERIDAILVGLEHLPLAVAIARSNWAFPVIETFHVVALSLTIGTVVVVDLRLLGIASTAQPCNTVRREVLPATWGAFVVAVGSGSLMFISRAAEYAANEAFRIKLVLLLLAGVNMLIFEFIIARESARWGRITPFPARVAALLSIILWISVVFFGRRIGFTMMPT